MKNKTDKQENKVVDILVILDRSGSMQDGRLDHEGGLNSFIEEQQKQEGEARLTLIQFDTQDSCEVVHDRENIHDVAPEFKLIPRSGTPLLDAIGKAVAHLEEKSNGKLDHVLSMIITDGYENSSREFTRDTIKKLIQEKESSGIWNFVYLGANVDEFAESHALGICPNKALGVDSSGVGLRHAYASMSSKLSSARGSNEELTSGGIYHMTDEDRAGSKVKKQ